MCILCAMCTTVSQVHSSFSVMIPVLTKIMFLFAVRIAWFKNYLCIKEKVKQKVAQKVEIPLGYFIFSKNHNEPPKVAQLAKNCPIWSPWLKQIDFIIIQERVRG